MEAKHVHKLTLLILIASAAAPAKPALSIVTVNMAKEVSAPRILAEWRRTPSLRDADVFLLQEVREEAKDSEGNPQMKARIRRIQRDRARRRMMQEVPKATAVVVNPTH